jgi:hypothetical protein
MRDDTSLLVSRKLVSPHGNTVQTRRTLRVEFDNPQSEPLNVVYTEFVPWYFALFLHTLSVEGGGTFVEFSFSHSEAEMG